MIPSLCWTCTKSSSTLQTAKLLQRMTSSRYSRLHSCLWLISQGINKCLDIVSASGSTDVILKMYDFSFNAMKGSKSDTTWFKTKLKLAKLLLDRNEAALLAKTLEELHKSCLGKDG